MRDPKRIARITAKLLKVWERYPDQRLGQLIVNKAQRDDPFYVEDDILETNLDKELEV